MTGPSSSGETAASPSAAAIRGQLAPSDASAQAIPAIIASPHSAISGSNLRRYVSRSPRRAPSAGSTNAGSAAGGYSTRKSRYGTLPSAIASPYFS